MSDSLLCTVSSPELLSCLLKAEQLFKNQNSNLSGMYTICSLLFVVFSPSSFVSFFGTSEGLQLEVAPQLLIPANNTVICNRIGEHIALSFALNQIFDLSKSFLTSCRLSGFQEKGFHLTSYLNLISEAA